MRDYTIHTGIDGFRALSAKQLRQQCASRGVDLTGCFDKDTILQRLQKALSAAQEQRLPRSVAEQQPVNPEPLRQTAPAQLISEIAPQEAHAPPAATQAGEQSSPSSPPQVAEQEPVKPEPARQPAPVRLISEFAPQEAHAPPAACQAGEQSSPSSPPQVAEQEPVKPEPARQPAPVRLISEFATQGAHAPPAAAQAGEQSSPSSPPQVAEQEPVKPEPARQPAPAQLISEIAPQAAHASPAAAQADEQTSPSSQLPPFEEEASVDPTTVGKESAALPSNAKVKLAHGLAHNSAHLADRCALEVIPWRALVKECKLLGIDVTGVYAKCEVIRRLMAVLETEKEHDLADGKLEEKRHLPQPVGPPVALSPFPSENSEPGQPDTPPSPHNWLFGDRVVEETAGQTAAGEESEVVEEIVLEGPNRTSSEPPQATPVHPAVASTRPRASISELFRLPLSELQARCEAEGIPVAPGEAKGLLISKLKQALSKTAAQAADSAKQVAEAQLDSPKKATDSQPEALTKPEPSRKAEPEVFHIGSDDETDNHSDDFFPEFPTFSTIPGATSASSEALPQELPTVLPEQSQPNAEFDIGDLQEDLADIHSDHTPKASGRDCFDWFNDEEEVLPKSKSAPGQVHATSPGSEASEKPSNSSDPQIDLPEPAATTPLQHFEDAKDRGDGSSSDRGDGAMFDFDDLDDLVKVNPLAADPAPEPTRPTPDRPEESEVEPEPKAAEPKAPKEEARPEPPVQPAPEQESPPRGNENPLLKFTTKELLELARSRGVDVRGCVEKSDIVDRLTRAPRAPQPPVQHKPPVRQNTQPMQTQSAGAPSKASGAPMPRFGRSYTWQGGHGHASHASQPPSQPPVSQSSTTAPRRPAKAHASKAGRRQPKAPSPTPEAPRWENLSSWSSRVQTWFNRYPGFTAMLPPEAEMWTDQELDVYFGSNGDIWPRGKRPAWFGKSGGEDAKPASKPQGPRTYPDLKVHFQTLDLAETTPPEIIRRHYRRLARDCHPDKHPDNVEEATRRFQQITEAYEVIANRLKL
ncbi:unnamed protein product [Effrenium voratum]|uniref:J domain-containing protein n=1 Tax=Effrenium voratum TaxID=2562239 RepID=A0AA36JH48_9DINO|nr:unnamed protein product [Effrenium voratum]CAJ1451853.1 unnamed protein product [Effrenium voratum]